MATRGDHGDPLRSLQGSTQSVEALAGLYKALGLGSDWEPGMLTVAVRQLHKITELMAAIFDAVNKNMEDIHGTRDLAQKLANPINTQAALGLHNELINSLISLNDLTQKILSCKEMNHKISQTVAAVEVAREHRTADN